MNINYKSTIYDIQMKNRQEYLASLPKKIMGAGCLFFDTEGKIDEISAYQFLPPKQALTLVSNKLARRINKCLTVSDCAICDRVNAQTLYLEDQEEK